MYVNGTFQYILGVSNFMKIYVVGGEFISAEGHIYIYIYIYIIDAFRGLCICSYKSVHITKRIQKVYVLHRISGINKE